MILHVHEFHHRKLTPSVTELPFHVVGHGFESPMCRILPKIVIGVSARRGPKGTLGALGRILHSVRHHHCWIAFLGRSSGRHWCGQCSTRVRMWVRPWCSSSVRLGARSAWACLHQLHKHKAALVKHEFPVYVRTHLFLLAFGLGWAKMHVQAKGNTFFVFCWLGGPTSDPHWCNPMIWMLF